jgi:hypothetical protein
VRSLAGSLDRRTESLPALSIKSQGKHVEEVSDASHEFAVEAIRVCDADADLICCVDGQQAKE